jgi:hypothetical protein
MDMNKRHAGVFLGSLLAAAVLSGVAAAGNPHGAAPGQTKHSSTASASVSGKATARGHAKHSSTATASASASGKATAHGRAKHQSSVTTSTSAAGNATGVKSSSTTRFNMSAPASSSSTKLYGNGRTAGQIAMQNGAGASAMLFGPGNSQPHKAGLCVTNGKLHLIDVHALKAHSAASCAAVSSTLGSAVGSAVGSALGSVTGSVTGSVHGKSVGVKAAAHGKVKASNRSGVLGASHSLGSVSGQAKAAHAVLRAASFTG